MRRSANSIVIAIVCALIVAVLALVVGSGSCGSAGGGRVASVGGATTAPGEAATENTSGESSNGAASQTWATGDYEKDLERLREELSSGGDEGANVRDASSSPEVTSAKDTYTMMQQRGLDGITLQSSFDINGGYIDSVEVDALSEEKYPSYGGTYYSKQKVMWQIVVNDGLVFAVPVASAGQQITQHIILTEADHLVQYNGITNHYSDWPIGTLSDGAKVVQVTKIDKTAIDSYSVNDIERM